MCVCVCVCVRACVRVSVCVCICLYIYVYMCRVDVVNRESLDVFVSNNLPASSSEYTVGSPRYNEYIAALDKVCT